MKTNDQVKHLFAHRQAGSSGNLHSDGTELRSYSTVIAFWENNVCFVSSNGMTQTTASKHLSGLASALRGSTSFYSSAFDIGRRPAARDCIEEEAQNLLKEFKNLPRKRYLQEAIERYQERRQEVIEIASRFAVELPELPEATGDLKEKAKVLLEEEKKRQEEKAKEQKRLQEEQRKEDKEHFEKWLTTGAGSFPRSFDKSYGRGSYDVEGTDYITIRGETVITSQGAEAPLEHVRKAVKFYLSRRVQPGDKVKAIAFYAPMPKGKFHPYHTNGHKIPLGHFTLDSIDEAGNVKAGCHRFSAAEIARFCETWKEVLK